MPLGDDDDDDDDDIGSFNTHDDEGNARTSTNKLGFTNKTTLFLLGPVHHTFLANFLCRPTSQLRCETSCIFRQRQIFLSLSLFELRYIL